MLGVVWDVFCTHRFSRSLIRHCLRRRKFGLELSDTSVVAWRHFISINDGDLNLRHLILNIWDTIFKGTNRTRHTNV